MKKRIICLEFNELCPELLSRWMADGHLPNFKRFFEQSHIITAIADEPGPENLEPWIQWYSLHTGLPYRQHGVQHLTDGPAAPYTDVWRILAANGLRVANCGSMNVRSLSQPGALFVPDPWCTSQPAYPREWNAYHRLVSSFVQDSSGSHAAGVTAADYARFLGFVATHGLRLKTAARIVGQVASDTVFRQDTAWRRAALLDKVQFDVFRNYWRHERPDFSSFFLNSTAHYQHAYWHCTFPEQFAEPPDPGERERFGAAILYGYQQMDELLAEFFALESQDALLMLCTALSQQSLGLANTVYYRFHDVTPTLARAGVTALEVLPVMSEQYNLRFSDADAAGRARKILSAITVLGEPLFFIDQRDPTSLFIGPKPVTTVVPEDAEVRGFADGSSARFADILYRLPTTKATTHHPESLMWIKTGAHKVHERKVSILDWLPTVLEFYGVTHPDSHGPLSGRSFLPLFAA